MGTGMLGVQVLNFFFKNTLTPLPQPSLQKNTLINQGFDRSCFTSKPMYPAGTYVTFNGLILPVFIQYDAILALHNVAPWKLYGPWQRCSFHRWLLGSVSVRTLTLIFHVALGDNCPAPLVKMFQALLPCVFKVPSHSVPINRTRGVCLLNKRENIIRERAGDRKCEAGYMLLSLSSDSLCLSVSPLRRTKHSFVVRFQRLGHWAKGTDSVSAPKIRQFSSETSAGGEIRGGRAQWGQFWGVCRPVFIPKKWSQVNRYRKRSPPIAPIHLFRAFACSSNSSRLIKCNTK